jgi:beta-lactamase regulating signal transducer with metallopeptidase domain
MDFLVYVIGHNAVGALVLAVVVLAVTHFWRHPRLAYWLWLLVLLKFFVPPVGFVDVPILNKARELEGAEASGRDQAPIDQMSDRLAIAVEVEGARKASHRPSGATSVNVPPLAAPRVNDVTISAGGQTNEAHGRRAVDKHVGKVEESRAGASSVVASVFFAWMCGSVIWLSVTTYRTVRIQLLLRGMLPAPESLKSTAEEVAGRLGLRSCPEVRFAGAPITPMVWCMGWRPLVVLPRQLMQDLPDAQVTAVLGHELAHIQRRDHWLRWVEVSVAAVYWWHPVAWLACRRLNEAQELCCDSLVVETFPDLRGGYAQAVFATTEFLSTSRTPLPVVASGFGYSTSLKRRIEMILKDRFSYRLSWPVRMCVLCIALIGLLWSVRVAPGEVSGERDVAASKPADWDNGDPSPRIPPLPGPNAPAGSPTRGGSGVESPRKPERVPLQASRTESGPVEGFFTPHFKGTVRGAKGFAEDMAAKAEELRKELALSWIGHTLSQEQATCKINVLVGDNLASGGATTFFFSGGKASGFQMQLQGPRDRILNDHLPHEIMRMILAAHFNRPVDRWADNGISQMVESAASRENAEKQLTTLDQGGRLYSLAELFRITDYPSDVLPIHFQGYSVIRFLVEQHGGKQKAIEFIEIAMADGEEEAIREHYGFATIEAFEEAWRAATLPHGGRSVPRMRSNKKSPKPEPRAPTK